MRATLAHIALVVLLCGPGVLLVLGWVAWHRISVDSLARWRGNSMSAGLIAASAAWLLLAAFEVATPYLRTLYGQQFFADLGRQSFPIGLLLSVIAIPLTLMGRGRVRLLSTLAASVVCWWWILGLITD